MRPFQPTSGNKTYYHTYQGAHWIDDLAHIFGPPSYAEVPPSSWAAFAEIAPYAPEEYACYDWSNDDAFYTLIVSREVNSDDSFFHAQLEVEGVNGHAYSYYQADILYFQVDISARSVSFFISHQHEYAPPTQFKVDTQGYSPIP